MIETKFILFRSIGDVEGVGLAVTKLPQVPSRGEVINIDGNPYLIVERSWALGDPPSTVLPPLHPWMAFHCFVKVVKASDFKVKIGSKEY